MEFIENYWILLLVALILILLVILAYLIDKETNKYKKREKSDVKEEQNLKYKDVDEEPFLEELEYDELDIEDIDDEFNEVISKKSIIDESLKESIDSMKIDPIKTDFEIEEFDSNIELPEIKIKKENNKDVWQKK